MTILILIPARMKATRLPDKPLAMIGDAPMIVQVWRRAMESGLGRVIVACDGDEIADAVRAAGGEAVLTDPDLPSGSDRIWAALQEASRVESRESSEYTPSLRGAKGDAAIQGPQKESGLTHRSAPRNDASIIVNLQGDVPTLEPRLLRELVAVLDNKAVDIATLVAPITRAEEQDNPAVVKAVLSFTESETIGRALYFTRATAPYGDGPRYHHIGVYAYRYGALERFVSLPPSPLELREKLEQLRALEAGMRIDAVVVDTVPLGVDTPEDLERARALLDG